jgi:hypothetical protein
LLYEAAPTVFNSTYRKTAPGREVEGGSMRRQTGRTVSVFLFLSVVVASASATNPGKDVNPNGFQSDPFWRPYS